MTYQGTSHETTQGTAQPSSRRPGGLVTRGLRAAFGILGGVLVTAAGACSGPGSPSAGSPQAAPAAPGPAVAAPAPQPSADGPCPYLDDKDVADINGQRVYSVRVSADQPHPACFFYRADGSVQLRTWIVAATPEVARATVDAAAPVATSDLAELPGGWSGGSQPNSDGAVFAVSQQGTAVVVTTNQQQTIKARRIAEQVIGALRL